MATENQPTFIAPFGQYSVEDPERHDAIAVCRTLPLAKLVALAASNWRELEGLDVRVFDPLGQVVGTARDGEWLEAVA